VSDVAIIDNGGANIASLRYALERLGATSHLTADAGELRAASRVILPGVGAAADAMARLRSLELNELIPQLAQPVLGICLGMQLLFASSEEGDDGEDTECLGLIAERVARFPRRPEYPVPRDAEPADPRPRRWRLRLFRAQLRRAHGTVDAGGDRLRR
jgi:glutamine amidotransferase